MMNLSADNKTGMIICNRLAVNASLRPRDRELVDSIMRQIIADPSGFRVSARQLRWLKDIYARAID